MESVTVGIWCVQKLERDEDGEKEEDEGALNTSSSRVFAVRVM